MRQEFQAQVGGNSRDEVMKNAHETWRKYVGNPDASLPWSAHITVTAADMSAQWEYVGTLQVDETSVDSRG